MSGARDWQDAPVHHGTMRESYPGPDGSVFVVMDRDAGPCPDHLTPERWARLNDKLRMHVVHADGSATQHGSHAWTRGTRAYASRRGFDVGGVA